MKFYVTYYLKATMTDGIVEHFKLGPVLYEDYVSERDVNEDVEWVRKEIESRDGQKVKEIEFVDEGTYTDEVYLKSNPYYVKRG